MKVKIKQRHIDKGVPEEPEACPLSLALKEQFKGDISYVGYSSWQVWRGLLISKVGTLPEETTEWIKSFDRGEKVSPVELEVF